MLKMRFILNIIIQLSGNSNLSKLFLPKNVMPSDISLILAPCLFYLTWKCSIFSSCFLSLSLRSIFSWINWSIYLRSFYKSSLSASAFLFFSTSRAHLILLYFLQLYSKYDNHSKRRHQFKSKTKCIDKNSYELIDLI